MVEFNEQCFGLSVFCSRLDLVYSFVGKKRALNLVGLSVLRFELDLVLYVVIWTQCSLFLFGLDVHCFGLSMPAHKYNKILR